MIWRSALLFFTGLATLGGLAERGRAAAFAQVPPEMLAQSASQSASQSAAGSPATDLPEVDTALLSVGTRGEAVGTLQQQLQQRGYYNGPVDGLYGAITQQAVETFQQDAGIPATGKIDIPTWEQLHTSERQAESAEAIALSADAPQLAETSLNIAVAQSQPEAAADAAPDSAADDTTPDPAAAPSQDATDELGTEPEAVADNDNDNGQFLIVVILIGAALVALGLGFAWVNRRRPQGDDDASWGEIPKFDTRFDQETGLTPSVATAAFPAATAPQSKDYANPSMTVANNGGNGGIGGIGALGDGSGRIEGTDAESAQMGETTRLAKVNITHELIQELQSPDPSQRRKAIWELGQRGNSTAIQPLVNSMIDADSKEKSLALAALSEIGVRSLRPMNRALAIALQDENPEVRKNAIRDLTRIYDLVVQVSQMLGHAVEDEDPEVRKTATWALEQLNRIRRLPNVDASFRSLRDSSMPNSLTDESAPDDGPP